MKFDGKHSFFPSHHHDDDHGSPMLQQQRERRESTTRERHSTATWRGEIYTTTLYHIRSKHERAIVMLRCANVKTTVFLGFQQQQQQQRACEMAKTACGEKREMMLLPFCSRSFFTLPFQYFAKSRRDWTRASGVCSSWREKKNLANIFRIIKK
jgi:hypothetical protein